MASRDSSLASVIMRVEGGERLPTDPWLVVTAPPSPGTAAVAAFPGHIVVAAEIDPAWAASRCPDLSAPLNPPFLAALEARLDLRVNNVDVTMLAEPAPGPPDLPLRAVRDADHPRVRRARRFRQDVRVWRCAGGILVIGRGVCGRWEAAIEVDEDRRGAGIGRLLAAAARCLVPRPVWAQIAPGNAASVRAFLAAGYRPVGAEALLTG
jgi:hypothetical protein